MADTDGDLDLRFLRNEPAMDSSDPHLRRADWDPAYEHDYIFKVGVVGIGPGVSSHCYQV